MADFRELWPGGPLFRQSGHFRLGTDSILLADFIAPLSAKRGVDLGCGSGILSLLLLEKSEKLHMTGLELLEEAAAAARENLAANALETRAEILCGDIRRVKALFPCGAFDLAAANPPYYPLGRGAVSPRPARAAARAEGSCTLDARALSSRAGAAVSRFPWRGSRDLWLSLEAFQRGFPTRLSHEAFPQGCPSCHRGCHQCLQGKIVRNTGL